MKTTRTGMTVLAAVAMAWLGAGCAEKSAPEPAAGDASGPDKLSYSIGVDIGRSFKRQGIAIQGDSLAQGLRDALAEGQLAMTDEEMRETLMAFQAEMMQKQAQVRQAREAGSDERRKAGEAFLEANQAKDGVVTLPSGLQYKIIKAGEGPKPEDGDSVECQYRGTLIDGREFDSSHRRGQPATFAVTGVIPGWTEALKLMPVGSTWQLFIPSNLAYGPRGAGPDIGPHETLIFELELLGIK